MLHSLRPSRAVRPTSLTITILALAFTGCVPTASEEDSTSSLTNLLSSPLSSGDLYAEAEPNNDMPFANLVPVASGGQAEIDATLAGTDDIDVFALGAATAGDELNLTIQPQTSMSISVAVFDGEGSLIQLFRLQNAGRTPRNLQAICRAATSNVYVLVTGLDGQSTQGGYTLGMRRTASTVPAVVTQVIVLDFDGDPAVSIAGGTPINVPAFDASLIDSRFASQTSTIRQAVIDNVRGNFTGLNVSFVLPGDPAASGEHSTIYFGTYNPQLLGLADNVDTFNGDRTQNAIIYTDTFALFSVLNPTASEIARAISNTTSHEAGHLLGLWHTHEATDLMDISASARQMLKRQAFLASPLHETVLPIGNQNEANLLQWTVGGILKVDNSNLRALTPADLDDRPDFPVDRRLLSTCLRCQ